jgi:hypothetical protein
MKIRMITLTRREGIDEELHVVVCYSSLYIISMTTKIKKTRTTMKTGRTTKINMIMKINMNTKISTTTKKYHSPIREKNKTFMKTCVRLHVVAPLCTTSTTTMIKQSCEN